MTMLNAIDFYKTGHGPQYPEGTSLAFSNWTPWGTRIKGDVRLMLDQTLAEIRERVKD